MYFGNHCICKAQYMEIFHKFTSHVIKKTIIFATILVAVLSPASLLQSNENNSALKNIIFNRFLFSKRIKQIFHKLDSTVGFNMTAKFSIQQFERFKQLCLQLHLPLYRMRPNIETSLTDTQSKCCKLSCWNERGVKGVCQGGCCSHPNHFNVMYLNA